MARRPGLSIRNVLLSLGVLGILIAVALAGFGLLGTQLQSAALERVLVLEQALHNHTVADAFMDDIRADVLRALQASAGGNKEGEASIRADLHHHVDVVNAALTENLSLVPTRELQANYAAIVPLAHGFAETGRAAVDLALRDPVAGVANFEHFRHEFSTLEDKMDEARDVLVAEVRKVREGGEATATIARHVILVSSLVGVVLLVLITAVAVRIVRSITTDLANSREQAHHLALHDTLTGLPNRVLLGERLTPALASARRNDSGLAMMCIDLDRFKQVNDTLGHPVGDLLLRAVADRLSANLRESDTVARLGGDEFAVVQFPSARVEEAGSLARRLVDVLSQPFDIGGHQVVVGASIGIASAPNDTSDADDLLKMADMALYRAKVEGRSQFRFFEPSMDAKLQARRLLELDLRNATETQEFVLHYQPLIDLASGKVTGFEALVRWHHPERGMVPPAEFIPLAEETGLIVPLGAWVLSRACADAAAWPADVDVAVNISAVQFKRPGLVAAVLDALTSSGLASGRLELEITETAMLTDADATLSVLHELRALGVRIAMDDFGTGYSSLGYLRSFPFDKIKIDQCFVRDIETSADCKAIVRAITGLGSSLGITTTVEGVETIAQLEQVRAEGCDQVQGYYFSRPVPVQHVAAFMDRAEAARNPRSTAARAA